MNRICSENSVLEVPGLCPLYDDSGEDQNPIIFFSDSSPLSDGTKNDINKKKAIGDRRPLPGLVLCCICVLVLCNS